MLPMRCCWNHLHKFSYYINALRFSTSCSKTDSCFWTKNQFDFALLDMWYVGGKKKEEKKNKQKITMKINCIFHLKEQYVLPPSSPLSGVFSININIFFCPAVSSQCNLLCNLLTGVESLYQPQIAFFLADKKHFWRAKLSPFQRHLQH